MLYTSQEKVEGFLGRSLTDNESAILSTLVAAIEDQIDSYLETTFKNDPSLYGINRYYDGGMRYNSIDPVQNVTAIAFVNPDGDVTYELTSDLYVLRPFNSNIKRSISVRYGRFPRGLESIRVTGDFTEYGADGEAGVPSDIQLAATRLVGAMFMLPEAAVGIQQESVEGHSVTYQRDFQGEAKSMFESDPVVRSILSMRSYPVLDDSPNRNALGEEAEDTLGIY